MRQSITVNVSGLDDLQKLIHEVGQVPQKSVTKAAKKGATIELKATQDLAPFDKGNLKRALRVIGERSRFKGKKVYQVTFDRAMNDVLVKFSKDGKRSYYPVSQEYGFVARNGRFIPGYHYLEQGLNDNVNEMAQTMIDVLSDELEKVIGTRG